MAAAGLIQVAILAAAWLLYVGRRFGWANAACFAILNGAFPGGCDALGCLGLGAYHFPGRSPLYVVTYLTLGWLSVAAVCLFMAEGLLGGRHRTLLAYPAWQVGLVAGGVGVALDMLMDPKARSNVIAYGDEQVLELIR